MVLLSFFVCSVYPRSTRITYTFLNFSSNVFKIGAAVSGRGIADRKFYGHEDFSDLYLILDHCSAGNLEPQFGNHGLQSLGGKYFGCFVGLEALIWHLSCSCSLMARRRAEGCISTGKNSDFFRE